MGRSVMVPSRAAWTCYFEVEAVEEWEWDDFIDNVRSVVRADYPSFEDDDTWTGREERSVLSNEHALVVVCEYCGLASVSLVPVEERGCYSDSGMQGLHDAWCEQVEAKMRKMLDETFGGLRKVGTFSNGESVYERSAGHAG